MKRADRLSALSEILGNAKAEEVYAETKGYLHPILRHSSMGTNIELTPEWVKDSNERLLLVIFFISEWEERTESKWQDWKDTELVEFMSGLGYEDFSEGVRKLGQSDDAPIRKI